MDIIDILSIDDISPALVRMHAPIEPPENRKLRMLLISFMPEDHYYIRVIESLRGSHVDILDIMCLDMGENAYLALARVLPHCDLREIHWECPKASTTTLHALYEGVARRVQNIVYAMYPSPREVWRIRQFSRSLVRGDACRKVVLLHEVFLRGDRRSPVYKFLDKDGDHAISTRVLRCLLPSQ